MSIRIYALAKQLNVDSKAILDAIRLCNIEGKTPLSNLSPEEAAKVKEKIAPRKTDRQESDAKFERPSVQTAARVRNLDVRPAVVRKFGAEKTGSEVTQNPAETNPNITATESALVREKKEPEKILPVTKPVAEKSAGKQPKQPIVIPAEASAKEWQKEIHKPEITGEKIASGEKEDSTDESVKTETVDSLSGELGQKYVLPPALGKMDLSDLKDKRRRGHGKDKDKKNSGNQTRKEDRKRQTAAPQQPITTGYSQQGHAANVSRPSYIGPMRRLADKVTSRSPNQQDNERPSQRTAGGILLAAVPHHTQLKQKLSREPAAMKPDAKLPVELLKTTNVAKSIEEHIRNHTERQRLKEIERKERETKGKKGKIRDSKGGGSPDSEVNAVFEANKKKRLNKQRNRNRDFDDDGSMLPRSLQRKRSHGRSLVNTAAPRKSDIVIQLPATIKQFAEMTGISVVVILRKLMEMGTITNLNAHLDRESAELLATAFELQAIVKDEVTLENQLVSAYEEEQDPPEKLKPRPPVVTVLGHVDHGKTTLLDYILHLNVVSGEKGGITQHIRAYRVKMDNGQDITFVDTPGHEAFTEMRARGANCTDIVILVIAADDGVMPQTEEAISHAKAAGVPIVVALNKMDLPGMNADKVIQQLPQYELTPSEWGGDTEVIRCSGLTGMGVDKLLETVQLIAEMNDLKANPDRNATGMALESTVEAGQGVAAKVLVQNGTLKTGDVVLCGTSYGRVRAMYDTLETEKIIEKATPSTPVNLVGLDNAPEAGSTFVVLNDISDARRIAEQRMEESRASELASSQGHVTLENLFQRIAQAHTVQTLNVIIRADVRGSIEAIRKELSKLDHPEVKIKILQASVGGVTEGDVQLAAASDAIIVGFSVVPDENARLLAEKKKVQIRRYDIIYNLTDDIRKALEGMLKPVEQVKELGRALVQQIFTISRLGTIAGCRVVGGAIERDSKMRVIRDSRIIGEYLLETLKREKDDMKEIREGYECGIKLKGFNDIKEGDILEAYKIEEVARTF